MKIKRRILVVDDEPQIGRVLRISLAAQGFIIRVAADGVSAIKTFDDWQPDLIVTDLSMPHMNGLELCRKIRSHSQIPIIVVSARGQEQARAEAFNAGADEYVIKPFGINDLIAKIKTLLPQS